MQKRKLQWWGELSGAARAFWLAGMVFLGFAVQAPAHICGPPTRIVRPGDLFYYYILSDVIETARSDYHLNSVSDSTVVDVFPSTAFSAYYYGEFAIDALKSGQADVSFHWAYTPFIASGDCSLHVIVTNNVTLAAANYPQSAVSDDPVNAFTGGLTQSEPPDLDLGGPMPLQFRRYYDSGLDGSLLIRSPLGINWAHNFDTRVIRFNDRVDLVTFQGARAQFRKTNDVWQAINSAARSYQMIESVNGGTTNLVVGDRRANLIYTFDSFGEFISLADGKGNIHTLTYTNNSIKQVSDGMGRVIIFTPGGFQQLKSVSDGTRSVYFSESPDVAGTGISLLLSVTNPIGGVSTYTYDPLNANPALLTDKTFPRGNTPYTQVYDAPGRVIRQVELTLRTNKFVYGNGSTTITNPLGFNRAYTHNTNGALTAYKDEANQSVNITLNTNNQRGVITDRLGNKTGFGYDATAGKVSAVTNADGAVTRFAYTNYTVSGITFYVLSQVTFADGSTEKYFYDSVGNVTTRIERGGNVWNYTYNNHGQPLTIQNPPGGMTFLTYNPDGTLASSRDSDVGTTSYVYDSLRRLLRTVHPDGTTNSAQLDLNDRVTLVTDERGNSYHYYYDPNGNVTNIVDPNSAVLQYVYDGLDRAIMAKDRLGHSESVAYDALDRVGSFTDRNGNVTAFAYDARNHRIGVTNAAGKVWHFSVNAEDIHTSTTNPLSQAYWNRLAPTGFVTGHTNPLHNTSGLFRNSMLEVTDFVDELKNTNHFTYGSMGLLTSESRPRIGSISLHRDSLQLVQQFTDFNGQDWSYGYTDMGRPKSFSDPLNWSTMYDHNLRGQLVMTTFADGVTRSNYYDAGGNLENVHYSDGTDFSYGYDALNRPISGNWVSIGLDAEGRPTNTTSWGVNFGAAFDAGGRMTNATYNNGAFKVDYFYDIRNRLMLASNGLYGAWVRLNYDDADNVTNIQRANGISGTYTRDAAEQVARIQEGSFLDLQYTLNPAGKTTQLKWTGLLDPAKFALTASLSYSYNAGSQISNPDFHYDRQGRLNFWGLHSYDWNGASQLVFADNVTFEYNGWNEPIARTESGNTKWCYYNRAFGPNRLAGQFNVNTSQYERYYVWAPNGPLLFTVNPLDSSVSYPHYGRDGSTLALTDGTGKVTDAYAYSFYGDLLSHTGTISQPYLYLGAHAVRYEPTANLYQIDSRYYSPVLRSFLSPDSSWPQLDNPQSTPYSFANNDPLEYFNRGGFEARPFGKNFLGRNPIVEEVRVPRLSLFPMERVGGFNVGSFTRTYDSVQTMTGNALPTLSDSDIAKMVGNFLGSNSGGGDCCCCCDCCCCDCCCCCCCCCDCCCDGPGGPAIRIDLSRYARSGLYSPVRETSYSRFNSLTEAYRKFQPIRITPQFQIYLPSAMLPGMVSPSRAAGTVGDFRQERIFREYTVRLGSRVQF